MYEQRKSPPIKEYLRQPGTQEKIQRKIIEARSEATITITRAARLFEFSDTQLRDWDKLGFVRPPRSDGDKQEDKKHRQYSHTELDVLAAIRILRDGGYSITEIRQNIEVIRDIADQLGHEVFTLPGPAERAPKAVETTQEQREVPPIDQLFDNVDNELFWRFYAINALRLSLALLAEYNPNTIIGLILPLGSNIPASVTPATIADLGGCLIGWLRPGYSFYLLYTPRPSFEVHTDFRMHPLQAMQDNTWTVVQRKLGQLNISLEVRTTIQHLLAPLYEHKQEWLPFFKAGQHSFSFPTADFVPEAAENPTNRIHLTSLANVAVSMGRDKGWRFACVLTPSNPQLSVSEHQLIVQAVSENAPEAYKEKLEKTIIRPTDAVISVSMRAYQGGRICYRHRAVAQDESIFNYGLEQPLGSCIAVPIGGEEAKPLGVIYLASSQQNTFDEGDQRLLRMIARMAQELLLTFQVRNKIGDQLKLIMENPALADQAFEQLASETDFIIDTEKLLADVFTRKDLEGPLTEILALDDVGKRRKEMAKYCETNDVLTFYCFDINDQTRLTQKYGETMAHNLSREVGRRAKNILKTLFTSSDSKLYHAYGDRFYIRLGGIPLDEARAKVWALKKELDGVYKIDALRFSTDQPTPLEMRVQDEITVRIGISCYPAIKAYELMQRLVNKLDPPDLQAAVASGIRKEFDDLLKLGSGVWSWDPFKWRWVELMHPEG
jgi:DNA-binding transcriptional MerR regulator/GGDEF domain-containing protein